MYRVREREREMDVVGGTMENSLVSGWEGGRAASWNGVYTTYLEGGRRHDLYVQR